MPAISLPDEPSLEQLRNQAKDLRRAVLAGEPGALAEVAERFPDAPGPFPLHAAQLVVARRYGFPGWARLKRHVEVIERYSRFPDRMPGDGAASLADDFLRLVSLYYADDEPERWAEGRRLLSDHPEITRDSVHTAAAAADVAALRRILAADPAAARREGGPFRWPPLMYLAYARHDPQIAEDAVLSSAEMVRGQLAWAITHGMTERVRLLVSHGADVTSPFDDGATTTSVAATTGHADLVDYLVAHGAPPLGLDPAEAFVAAVLAPEIGSGRASLDGLLAEHPGLAAQVRSARPALITWAAACGRPEAVEILARLGFDVNAKGRTDMPSDQPWQTALHKAAEDGHLELARTLLRLGADPDIRDHRFDSTPLGWARYFGQQPLIDLLEPLTTPEPTPRTDTREPTPQDGHA
jgi:ankyrin repeat protein